MSSIQTKLTTNKLFRHISPNNFISAILDGTELEIEDFISGEKAFTILRKGGLYIVIWLVVQVLYESGNKSFRVKDIQNYLYEKLKININERTILQKLQELESDGIVEADRFPRYSRFSLKYNLYIETKKC